MSSGSAVSIVVIRFTSSCPPATSCFESTFWASPTSTSIRASLASARDGLSTSDAAYVDIAAAAFSSPRRPSIIRLSSFSFAARSCRASEGFTCARILSAAWSETAATSFM